jgi:hypothetical protein
VNTHEVAAASNDYHFVTVWTLADTTCEEVSAVLGDAADLARWWPSVYLKVTVTDPGGPNGVGKRVALFTKGFLPYRLRWNFVVTETREPHGFTLEADGDFVGRGVWTFTQDGRNVLATYDWKIRAEKGLLRRLSFVMKPVFSWNHRWAMRQGYESLVRELSARRAFPALS